MYARFFAMGFAFSFSLLPALAQGPQEPGRSIGTISTQGNLIVFELREGALGRANLFDLSKRTLRFTPDGGGYRIENLPLAWDSDYGAEPAGPQVKLVNFTFPFSGKNWDAFSVGITGSISFGSAEGGTGVGGRGGRGGGRAGGISVDRFAQLGDAGRTIINTVPAICVFFKPRMSGQRFVKEAADRVTITWDISEPIGNIQDFTWVKTVNRFQTVLHKDGTLEMSYSDLAARDAVVGVYPLIAAGAEKTVATINGAEKPTVAANLNLKSVTFATTDALHLTTTLQTRGPVIPEGDAALAGVTYRVSLDVYKPAAKSRPDLVWTIRGVGAGGRGGRGGGPRYLASGSGVSGAVKIDGDRMTIQGTLPAAFKRGSRIGVRIETIDAGGSKPADEMTGHITKLDEIASPEVDLSAVKKTDGPFPMVYEAFHYLALPNARDLTCTVIKALGDKFDLLAYYSDFRVDNQEAGTPSTGPRGHSPDTETVTGIGSPERGIANFCSQGRFQWQFIQPVYVGSNQMQERPPEGTGDTSTRNIAWYDRQLGERWPDGHMPPYNYAISQIAHEMGHRWSAFASAKVNGEVIQLGPTHYQRGLQAPVAFPYQRPVEASAMGGGVWQDNFDGTFTQLDDDYYVPATGWSYLDLYLMGLIRASEVPDFFLLRNLVPAGQDSNERPIFKADRTKITIQDVITQEGPRLPDVDRSQKKFNTGMVVMVEHGKKPSKELIDRTNAIRLRWMDYWETTTGHRSRMTTNVR